MKHFLQSFIFALVPFYAMSQDQIYFDYDGDNKIDWNANTGLSYLSYQGKNLKVQLPEKPLPNSVVGQGKIMMRMFHFYAESSYQSPQGDAGQYRYTTGVIVWNTNTLENQVYVFTDDIDENRLNRLKPEPAWQIPISKSDLGEGEYMLQPVSHTRFSEANTKNWPVGAFCTQALVWNTKNGKAKLFQLQYPNAMEWNEVQTDNLFDAVGEGEVGEYQYMVSGTARQPVIDGVRKEDYKTIFQRYNSKDLSVGKMIVHEASKGFRTRDIALPSGDFTSGKTGKFQIVRATKSNPEGETNILWIIDTQTGKNKTYGLVQGVWTPIKTQLPYTGTGKTEAVGTFTGYINLRNLKAGLAGKGHEAAIWNTKNRTYSEHKGLEWDSDFLSVPENGLGAVDPALNIDRDKANGKWWSN